LPLSTTESPRKSEDSFITQKQPVINYLYYVSGH
jgi:hypothetical protein